MFPVDESERPGARTAGEARALAVCAGCRVLAECRTAVLGLDGSSPLAYGVAGGMTREDRRAVRAGHRRLLREAAGGPAAAPVELPAASRPCAHGGGGGVSETNRVPSAVTRLARRLAAAARSTESARHDVVGRCAVPVAVDPWGAVSERCPLRPLHDGEHEIESADAQRERLEQAAAIDPARVLGAVDAVEQWLASANGPGVAPPPAPLRQLWVVVDVAGASAALDAVNNRTARRRGVVASDG